MGTAESVLVRPLEAWDLLQASQLFPGAVMHLGIAPGDGDAARRSFEAVRCGSRRAWIAEGAEGVVGLAVVAIESRTLAHLTYLHVVPRRHDHAHARHVAKALAETAIRDTWDAGHLKLVVHVGLPVDDVVPYMHDLGYEFSRTHAVGGEHVVEFYRNLYDQPARQEYRGSPVAHLQAAFDRSRWE